MRIKNTAACSKQKPRIFLKNEFQFNSIQTRTRIVLDIAVQNMEKMVNKGLLDNDILYQK